MQQAAEDMRTLLDGLRFDVSSALAFSPPRNYLTGEERN
jgi:hypothetical protein